MRKGMFPLLLMILWWSTARGQDSVDVTFRYTPPGGSTGVSLPGEFNNWNNTVWPMTNIGGGLYIRTARLRVGGPLTPPNVIPGAYQYKFYYSGISIWPNDPLNHHVNTYDGNNNSFMYIKNPTIYHLLPNQRSGVVTTGYPTISAYIFPKVGAALDTSALSLSVDGTIYTGIGSFYNIGAKQFAFVIPVQLANGAHTVILTAGTTIDTVTFTVAVGGSSVMPMPAYARHGVTLPSPASQDSTTFRLRVGGTSYVLLRVVPAGQPVATASPIFMRKNTTTDDWWMNFSLAPGEYEYLYQTDNGNLIYDPWGRWNGTYGSRFTIGPAGLAADDYIWRSDDYIKPSLNNLILYELHVGEFAGGYYDLPAGDATFTHLTSLLPYFDSLGVNGIEFMPIMDYGPVGASGHSWGYDLNSLFSPEPAYGTPRDLKVLVDSAHALGIAVILDVVFNHLNETSPLWRMQPDEAASPYFKACSDRRYNEDDLCFFRDLDHWTAETQEIVYTALKMWIDEYRIDGFRYDFTQGIGWNISEPTKGILGWANRIDTEYGGSIYQIAEHLPESPALIYHSGLTGGWHDSYRDEIFDEARYKNSTLFDFENLIIDLGAYAGNDNPSTPSGYANRTEPVNANVTHDEQSLIYEMTTFQSVPLAEAIKRDILYSTFMFTSLGIPMLWQSMEFGASRGWTSDGQKLSYRPVEWSLLPTARGQEHYRYYRALIFQRTHNPALFNGSFQRLARYIAEKTLVWGFDDAASGAMTMAVANLSPQERTIRNVPWLAAGGWYDIFDQTLFHAAGTTIDSITIPAFTARVYSNRSDSVLLPVHPAPSGAPADFMLRQNYPNPFNPSTTIEYSLPERGQIRLTVHTILGEEIAVLENGMKEAGSHRFSWKPQNLSSGVYLYRLMTPTMTSVGKMLYIR